MYTGITGAQPNNSAAADAAEGSWQDLLAQIPIAAYTCNATGLLTYFNPVAEAVWGRTATLRDSAERYCGSYRLYSSDGTPMPHSECWMARALREGKPYNGYEVVIERRDGTRTAGVAYANPVRDSQGQIIGAVALVITKALSPCISTAPPGDRMAAIPEDAALAMTEVTLGLFANLAWPTHAFN